MEILEIIGRQKKLFSEDLAGLEAKLSCIVADSSFLVLGGAGSIGQAVCKEIFKRNPKKIFVVDISENNLVELVRDIRSEFGYIKGEFATFAIDIGSEIFDAFIAQNGTFDYVLNLSALKHVRSEKDPFTLMRMIKTNILNTDKTIKQAANLGAKKYFCVSTDKAANPVNMMGASKRIMEMFAAKNSREIKISMARFANVAFSDGSLLYGFKERLRKRQPIVAPNDIKRYFVTPEESGELCLLSCLLGENLDIFFPKLSNELHLITFSQIAVKFLKSQGLTPHICNNEDEARALAKTLPKNGAYPCLFTPSDTTGEKDFEEFFTEGEILDLETFKSIGVIKNEAKFDINKLENFKNQVEQMIHLGAWDKEQILALFCELLPNFTHKETGKYLDGKM
ncbi:UDP-N-acetylglucosamine 4,6-dehydratase [uncultured Campylobacter sp.]|uniref:UDP-N-acetylglucosamine 4,6-dehydratase n=1 Tax=uncultured Campylobacter sp. TaxID=218934 RepID=UPI00344E6FDB